MTAILNPGEEPASPVPAEQENEHIPNDDTDTVRWSCGTGQQENKIKTVGSCLPLSHDELSETPSEPADKHIVCGPQNYDPDKVEPRPCGYQGQSLPGMGADDTKGEEEEGNKEAEKSGEGEVEQQELPAEIEEEECPKQDSEQEPFAEKDDQEASGQEETTEIEIEEEPSITVVNQLADLSDVLVKVEGRGNTGRIMPNNYAEKLAMNEVMSNPQGKKIALIMNDPTWPAADGWAKMHQAVEVYEPMKIEAGEHHPKLAKKYKVVIHYVYNARLHLFDDFKFKDEKKG